MSSEKMKGGGESLREGSESGSEERPFGYSGWVYHVGVNSVGHEYCHLRFLLLKGTKFEMYKRDPQDHPGIKPIRRGVIGHTLMVEDLGRRRVNNGDLYVLRFYDRLNEKKKGEIACATAGDAQKWIEAFDQAKQQAGHELYRSSHRHKLTIDSDSELNLEGHRSRVRLGLKKLIKIGKGPEMLLHQSSDLGNNIAQPDRVGGDFMDAVEAHKWKCVHTVNGIRIFEDVSSSQNGGIFLLKSVGVVEANLDTVFEVVCSLDQQKRYEWDVLTGDLELIDSVNGHFDVIYGTYDTKYLSQWHSKRDFVFSRQWFRGQDGSYTIIQIPAEHKNKPPRKGYRRIKINPSIWEIRGMKAPPNSVTEKCVVTHMLEIHSSGWGRWKKRYFSKFEKTIPYLLLCQVTGLREFFNSNPASRTDSSTITLQYKRSEISTASIDDEDSHMEDQFYDAIAADDSLEDEDSDDDEEQSQDGKVKLKNVSWAIASLALQRSSASAAKKELDASISPIDLYAKEFHGSMRQGKDESDTNCWTSLTGQGFMIRGKTYLKDSSKVPGGEPLLKLLAVDWFRTDNKIDQVALDPKCLVQTEAAKMLPFILIINLQVPAKPDYSLILYYGADRPIKKDSVLCKFVNGSDMYRDARFKLIPSIVEGYWMIKRAVGAKACLLGKAVTCKYLRQANFLEIDVDIGSSSVARSIISLVLGYITGIVVDLAILIEATKEEELPEYILGTVRLNRVKVESAVPF